MLKKGIYLLFILFLLVSVNNLVRSIYDVWQKQQVLSEAQQELATKQEENSKLKYQLSYAQSQEFIEQEARNKLFLIKPGEQEVVIAQSVLAANTKTVKQEVAPKDHWQEWLLLFHIL